MEGYKYKLSIIIPMYNAEKYIANCLDSILNSDLPKDEYEVIIVNDGSTDNGPTKAQKYVLEHENFMYLTQENQGQSVARNKGIELCNGEYIWFVDADDMICPAQKYIFDFIANTPTADVVKTIIRTYQEGIEYNQLDGSYTLYSGRALLLSNHSPASVCDMIIKKSILINNSIRFVPRIVSQDVEFSHRVYVYAKNIYIFNYINYLYVYNPNSTTRSEDIDKVHRRERSNFIVSTLFYNFSETIKNTDPELSQWFYDRSGSILFGQLLTMIKKRKDRKANNLNKLLLDDMKELGVYPLKYKFNSIKKFLAAKVINVEPLLRLFI